MKKQILIIVYSHINKDPRVQKQIEALQKDYEIETAGKSGIKGINNYQIQHPLRFSILRKAKRLFFFIFNLYEKTYWDDSKKQFIEKSNFKNYDLIIANDISTLPLAFKIAKKNTKIYFDAHEYHPKEFEDSLKWRILHQKLKSYLCKKYIPKVDYFSTVGKNIANEYEKFVGVRPEVIMNTTDYNDKLRPSKIKENKIKIIHHGAAIPSRKIELMIETALMLDDRFLVDFMLVGDSAYIKYLKKLTKTSTNINIIKPVDSNDIVIETNKYDLGIFLLPLSNLNYKYALPNKLFEFVQARLGIVTSPNPEMKSLIEQHQIGTTSSDFSPKAMAKTINQLTKDQIIRFKTNAHKSAYTLSSKNNIDIIKSNVKCLLS